ncbi:uncharacterized protein K452DRAFT_16436 [Aplosporella prunicola CBS 121167]|uniref:PD-(D/E)XK nuclease-like domain-containing protein n=1 Tax=Aplosporella prunicola CBS 121167 TaxID=1176127 RepID=A0A6A6AXF5_9PEZI|nr:uncharacterized protein K452DRAFT_16436 [Aplosporella prunicola CBS 121167]KAF2135467.1 hypothetical protein K452DRAFT_16436 [Aplosporella prunicola CBS 121167]
MRPSHGRLLARIYPKDLIPRDYLGTLVEVKIVNYAVLLDPSYYLSLRLDALLHTEVRRHPATASRTINDTAHDTLRRKPVAISIKTEMTAANKHEEKGQPAV